jgi:hypothetical protein
VTKEVSYRGVLPTHGYPITRHAPGNIDAATMTVFVLRGPVVLCGGRGARREEGRYLCFDICILSVDLGLPVAEELYPLVRVGRGIDPEIR